MALALTLFSLLWVHAGVEIGKSYVPAGKGLGFKTDLFRFDSEYYFSIAEYGYAYNGDPASSPNIVFAPGFPLLARGLSTITPLDTVTAGFVVNEVLLFFAVWMLLLMWSRTIGWWRAGAVTAAVLTAAGSYAFHAYYSESTTLFFLAAGLLALTGGRRPTIGAICVGLLGLSRVAMAPMCLVVGGFFAYRAWKTHKPINVLNALLSISGTAVFLGFIWLRFGNPFTLIPEIQGNSWGLFHQPVPVLDLLWGKQFFLYWGEALARGFETFGEIKTLNLVWMTLGLAAALYGVIREPRALSTYVFAAYFLLLYVSSAGSDFLISAHRFFALMLPIYLMFNDLESWLERRTSPIIGRLIGALFLLVNAGYGLFHAAYFNQGVWYYF